MSERPMTRAELDALDAEADAAQATANAWLERRDWMQRLRKAMDAEDAMPDESDFERIRDELRGMACDIADDAIAYMIGLRNELSYAYPLAMRYCRAVLDTESVGLDDGWKYWNTSVTDPETGHILHWMAAHEQIELHETDALVWRYTNKETTK